MNVLYLLLVHEWPTGKLPSGLSAILSNKFISYTQTGHTVGGVGVQLKLCTNTLGSLHF